MKELTADYAGVAKKVVHTLTQHIYAPCAPYPAILLLYSVSISCLLYVAVSRWRRVAGNLIARQIPIESYGLAPMQLLQAQQAMLLASLKIVYKP